jgi:Tfp pilus assembly protein PilF
MRQIGATLGAANLLQGSVQQAGNTVRITVQLIRAADGSHLWSHHYDRPMADVFKIQDEVATQVVQALRGALPQAEQQRLVQKRTQNVDAYQEYLKGIALLPNRKVPEMRAAAQHFERAIEIDPSYARAYAAAGDAYELLDQYATINATERERKTRYIDRALALAPDLGEAHISRANVLANAGNPSAAEPEYRRGLELAPGYATGNQWYAEMLAVQGRFDEALPVFEKAIALDPLSPVIRDAYILNLGASGRVDEALALSNQQIARHPDIARQYNARGQLYEQRGDLVAALRDLRTAARLDPDALGYNAFRCHVLIEAGALVEAKACVASFAQEATPSNTLLIAEIRLALIAGDAVGALAFTMQMQPANEQVRAYALLRTSNMAEALAIYRKLDPAFFVQPTPQVHPGQANDAILAGIALIRTDAKLQGQALLQAAITAIAHRPHAATIAGRGWLDVYAYDYLGARDRAFVALQDGVNAGYFLSLAELDSDPLLADLRADPRYAKILAPARAKAAAQVEAARRARLL